MGKFGNLLGVGRFSFGVRSRCSALIVSALCCCGPAFSSEGFQWRGFLTAGYTEALTDTQYLSFIGSDPNFLYDSLLGVAFSKTVGDTLEAGAQLVASGALQNYIPNVDWAFITYRPTDNVMVRAGKIRFPMWLISDYYYVGVSYPWARPPQEIYALNILTSFFGALARYEYAISSATLSLSLFGGSSPFDVPTSSVFKGQTVNFRLTGGFDRVIGLTAAIESLRFQARASYANAVARLQAVGLLDVLPGIPFGGVNIFTETTLRIPIQGQYNFWSGGLQWKALDNLRVTAEYVGSKFQNGATGHNGYVTLGVPFGIFEPHFTLARAGDSSATNYFRYALGMNAALAKDSMLKLQIDGIDVKRGNGPLSSPPGNVVYVVSSNFSMVF